MRPVRAVGLFLVFVFLGGALLAPGLYYLVQGARSVLPGFDWLASKPFPRYVNRALIALALVGLWPFLRATGLASWRAIGLGFRPGGWSQIAWGFSFGLVSLACIVFIVIAMGGRAPAPDLSARSVLLKMLKAAATAAAVAPLEELLFRGALFGALRKTFHWMAALVLSSAIYALLHFLERAEALPRVNWHSGVLVLASMFRDLGDAEKLIPGFLNLTLVGIILGLAYQRSGSLYLSIGLHAGWIFWLKIYEFLTAQSDPGRAWFFGTDKLINGWLAFFVLGIVLLAFSRFLVEEDPNSGWKERRLFS